MPIYFVIHDAERFHQSIRPALTACWRQRSFVPSRPLCESLLPAVRGGAGEPLLAGVLQGLAFDRDLWRLLVGEVLLYAAVEVPALQTALESLLRLLAPDAMEQSDLPREQWPAIRQAHLGSRDLVFGGYYRPDHAGLNDVADVRRLAESLAVVDPSSWTRTVLLTLTDDDEEDANDELEFARQCFSALRDLYRRAAAEQRIVLGEVL